MNPAEDLGSAIGSSLGSSIAYALLWWPICFLAAKGSFHLTYRWRPFLSGFAWSIAVLTMILLISTQFMPQSAARQDFDDGTSWVEFGKILLLPIAVCICVVIALRRRFVPVTKLAANTRGGNLESIPTGLPIDHDGKLASPSVGRTQPTHPARPHLSPSVHSWLFTVGASLRDATGAWIVGTTLLGILVSALYPPWIVSFRGIDQRLGHATFFEPPTSYYTDDNQRIDYPLLATQCVAIVALGGIAGVLSHLFRQSRAGREMRPAPLLDVIRSSGNKLIIAGYRRVGAERGCAPTMKTSDDQIVEMYGNVASKFQKAAETRGERLKAGILNTIVLKFLQVKEQMGDPFFDEHLEYELNKYRSEGLRPEYQRELRLF